MEDTLVEVKANCAGAIAARKKAERAEAAAKAAVAEWEDRASLAIDKGRDDLAREALREKTRFAQQAEAFRQEAEGCAEIVGQYKADIAAVEERLQAAREKHRLLVQRHIRAHNHKQAQTTLRRATSVDALARFDHLENRIERMEAEASLVNYAAKGSLVEQLEALRGGDQIEKELEALKRARHRD
jgi:phage shock protein A